MYLQNKYTVWYHSIIDNAKIRILEGYGEVHHIIPKSLGGSNSKENLVKLTAREHFICHLLLTKMLPPGTTRNKMIHAAWAMTTLENPNQDRYKVTSKTYESLRIQYSLLVKLRLTGKVGRKHSEETKQKQSKALKGKTRRPMSEESKKKLSESLKGKNEGKVRTEEQKLAQSIRQTGRARKPHTDETKQKLRERNLGKKKGPISEEHKQAISNAVKGIPKNRESVEKQRQKIIGRTTTEIERKNYLKAMKDGITTCEYCGKTSNKGNYFRWHGLKCKLNINIPGEQPI